MPLVLSGSSTCFYVDNIHIVSSNKAVRSTFRGIFDLQNTKLRHKRYENIPKESSTATKVAFLNLKLL
jgi:hypothetical protein